MGDINVVLPYAKSMSLAQPVEPGALVVRLSNCTIASAAGAVCRNPADWHLTKDGRLMHHWHTA